MANWTVSKSMVLTTKSYESTSHAEWTTQSKTTKVEEKHPKNLSREFEESLWSILCEFNAPIPKTTRAMKKVMKLVEKYCRFRSHVSKPSHATKVTSTPKPTSKSKSSGATKSFDTAKSFNGTKPSKPASKQMNAPKSLSFSKFPDATKPSTALCPFGTPNLLIPAKASSTIKNSLAVVKPNFHTSTPATAKHEDSLVAELRKELQRLQDSDGFVPVYPSRYKRVPKPVERFTVTSDKKRARRSSRRSSDRRQSDRFEETDNETPKKKQKQKKMKAVDNESVCEVQQHQTVTQTTSTIGAY